MRSILLFFLVLSSCARNETPSDDYVLIEFAAKLEEDYHKLEFSNENKKLKKD